MSLESPSTTVESEEVWNRTTDPEDRTWPPRTMESKHADRDGSEPHHYVCTCWPSGDTGHDPDCALWTL